MRGTSWRKPGFVILPASVVAAWPRLTDKAARVAVALASFMGDAGECFPSREKIIERAGLSCLNSVTLGIKELRNKNLVNVRRRPNTSSLYTWTDGAGRRSEQSTGKSVASTFRTAGKSVEPTTGKSVAPTSNYITEQETASATARKLNVWGLWVDANREAKRPDPVREGADLGAARNLGKLIASGDMDEDGLRRCMALYLGDDDNFLVKNGHALRHLSGRINRYLAESRGAEPPPLDAAIVDELEREPEQTERESQ